MAFPREKEVADAAVRKELKRALCDLIDDASSVRADMHPVLRPCVGVASNGFSIREPVPGYVKISLVIETSSKHPVFRKVNSGHYAIVDFSE